MNDAPEAPAATDHEWLRRDCEFRIRVVEPGYGAREVIRAGGGLYDPQVRWAEGDGSVVVSDIGGQAEPGWNPNAGHGAIFRLRPDDRLEAIVPPGMKGAAAPLRPLLAPATFTPWGGHIFFVAQARAGRAGAHVNHVIYRVAPGSDTPEVFTRLPDSGTIGGGIPGAGMPGTFGRAGSGEERIFYCQSLMNCTVYRMDADGGIAPYLVLAPPLIQRRSMPLFVEYAPDYGPFSQWAGELVISARGTSYLDRAESDTRLRLYRIVRRGPRLEALPAGLPRIGVIAPPGFGRFGGEMFSVDEGSTNLLHADIDKVNSQPLAYDARILRVAPDGSVHTFAEGLQGGSTTIAFSGDRMIVGSARKSYSTGEYHEPDGSIAEIRPTS